MSETRPSTTAATPERRIFGVSQLVAGLRRLLEDRVGRIWVVGEISNLFMSGAGHAYFSLQDDRARVKCVLFRQEVTRVPFELEDGLEVVVYAEVGIYEARGDLQLVVRTLEPRGTGSLQLAFEQLRRRLEAEGVFDAARKRRLPEHPRRVGVVTSAQGAALRDVIHVSGRRHAATPLLISPTRVQGDGAAEEIALALDRLATRDDIDVIILVRGGGSLEDLWAFNTEPVVRAIERCPVPVVSGVGHETDTTLADLVADARAPTPSAAAALVLPDRVAQARQLTTAISRLTPAMRGVLEQLRFDVSHRVEALRAQSPALRLARSRTRLGTLAAALVQAAGRAPRERRRRYALALSRLDPRSLGLERRRMRNAAALEALPRAARAALARGQARLGEAAARLESLSPLGVLSRGYAIARRPDGSVVRGPDDIASGDALRVRVARAEIDAVVGEVRELDDD